MRNFIILFQGKEGSTPLVAMLDNHPEVTILRTKIDKTSGWEPFDIHRGRRMTHRTVNNCLDIYFAPGPVDMEQLHAIYRRERSFLFRPVKPEAARGFKIRWKSTMAISYWRRGTLIGKLAGRTSYIYNPGFRRMLQGKMKQYNLVVFVLVRQDMLRWALSRYHGDGTGRHGHIQFKMAKGQIDPADIPKIHVDPDRLARMIARAARQLDQKRTLIKKLRTREMEVHPIFYEDMLADRRRFYREILERIEVDASDATLDAMIKQDTPFRKVHHTDISTFVQNHTEILQRFGEVREQWPGSFAWSRASVP